MDKNNDGTIEWLEFADSVAARWHPASQRLVSRAFESLFTHAFIADASRSAQHCFARHLSTGSSVDMDTATGIDFEILVSKEDSVGMATPLPPDSGTAQSVSYDFVVHSLKGCFVTQIRICIHNTFV
jgi:hypothetical protein